MIQVTRPFLPPQGKYNEYVKDIWNRRWLTNNGPLVNKLELKLKSYLNLDHMIYVGNGTIALQLAIKALELKGEIITTPFSYVATSSSIVWENCQPVFADIDSQTFNIEPKNIGSLITDKTTGILATHCFGNPCDIQAIQKIADDNNLKVIYDAAHSFGTKYNGKSIFQYGDISTCSFHATKLFHTIEGGAVFTREPQVLKKLAFMRNFGHDGPEKFQELGINAKNSEFHAAMGLCNLEYIEDILMKRKVQSKNYDNLLANLNVETQLIANDSVYNYSYYPIVFEEEGAAIKAKNELEKHEIYPRRYFHPSLETLPYIKENYKLVNSESVSKRILCLPLFYDLNIEDQEMIARLLLRIQNN